MIPAGLGVILGVSDMNVLFTIRQILGLSWKVRLIYLM